MTDKSNKYFNIFIISMIIFYIFSFAIVIGAIVFYVSYKDKDKADICTNKEIYNKTIEELTKLPNSYLVHNGYNSSRICVGEIYDERSNAIIYMLIDIVY